jgi:hypothetical protein
MHPKGTRTHHVVTWRTRPPPRPLPRALRHRHGGRHDDEALGSHRRAARACILPPGAEFLWALPAAPSSLAREDNHGDPAARRVEPVGYRYLASVASSVLAAYVAASATGRSDQRRTWTRPAATGLYVELLTAAMAARRRGGRVRGRRGSA